MAPGVIVAAFPSRLRERTVATRGYVRHVVRLADGRFVTVETQAGAGAEGPSVIRLLE